VTAPVVLAAESATVGYVHRRRTVPILERVSLALHRGELACLLGPNGAGKSTLLRSLVGAQPVLDGVVRLDGRDVSQMTTRERARHLSVVLTDRIDVGYLDVRTLVGFGRAPHLGWFATMDASDRDIVDRALDAAGASDLTHRMVHELSDGERQRAMIARALAQQPRVLVLDEPTAFLDVTRRVELVALLRRLTRDSGLAVLMSTHEVELAMHVADTAWLIHPDGTYDSGGPEDLALDHGLHRAFAAGDVTFDRKSGSFVTARTADDAPPIVIEGDAEAVTWGERAVRRAGWHPATDAAVRVRIELGDGPASWVCSSERGDGSGRRLATLVDHLRQLTATPKSDPTPPGSTKEHYS
jgi:iron complex transport system ATP-binding protein